MARSSTKSRAKARPQSRRPAPRPARGGGEFPILPVAVGGVLLLVVIGLIVYVIATNSSSGGKKNPSAFGCGSSEQLAVHYHANLQLIYHGTPATIPALVGASPGGGFCWLHTHTTDGTIHIEAPKEQASRGFTLADFFKVWDQPLSRSQVATITVQPTDQLTIFVKESDKSPWTTYTDDPAKIKLKAHERIVIDIEPSGATPASPTPFSFPSGE